MSTLPELTDEQIDAAWTRANTTKNSYGPRLNRGLPTWRELRAAFPKPKPPPPAWFDKRASVHIEGGAVRLHIPHASRGCDWPPDVAREFAAGILACADWIEANR